VNRRLIASGLVVTIFLAGFSHGLCACGGCGNLASIVTPWRVLAAVLSSGKSLLPVESSNSPSCCGALHFARTENARRLAKPAVPGSVCRDSGSGISLATRCQCFGSGPPRDGGPGKECSCLQKELPLAPRPDLKLLELNSSSFFSWLGQTTQCIRSVSAGGYVGPVLSPHWNAFAGINSSFATSYEDIVTVLCRLLC